MKHRIIYEQQVSPQATEGVCECGALLNSYASTMAARFAEHVRAEALENLIEKHEPPAQ